MSDGPTIGDHRFVNLSEAEAITLVRAVSTGRGSRAVADSSQGLANSAWILFELDVRLRTELGKLGFEWQSYAADLAHELLDTAAEYGSVAYAHLYSTALSVEGQGTLHANTRNGMPTEDEIRITSSENAAEKAAGIFGYESDFDRDEKIAEQARNLVAHQMNMYQDTTRESIDAFRPLPPPPEITLTADPPPPKPEPPDVDDPGGTVVPRTGSGGPGGGAPGGSPTPPAASQPPPVVPAPTPGAHAPGPLPTPTPAPDPGTAAGRPGAQHPGWSPPLPASPGGPRSGEVPARGTGSRLGHAAGAGAGKSAGGGGPAAGSDTGRQSPPSERGAGRPGATGPFAGEASGTARGAAGSRGLGTGSGFAAPAAAGGRHEEDTEHSRKYGIPTAEPFEENYVLPPPVIGADRST